jgi:hypothetical protein
VQIKNIQEIILKIENKVNDFFFLLIFSIDRYKNRKQIKYEKDLLKLYYQILLVFALVSEKGYHYGLPSLDSKDINLLYLGIPHLCDDYIPTKTYT